MVKFEELCEEDKLIYLAIRLEQLEEKLDLLLRCSPDLGKNTGRYEDLVTEQVRLENLSDLKSSINLK